MDKTRFKWLSWMGPNQKSKYPKITLISEMEKAILVRISDQNTLLKCRRVCSHWKQMIDSLLEQRRLSLWSDWEPELNSYLKLLQSPIWVQSGTDYPNQYHSSSHICRPPALKTVNEVYNPFPDKSEALINCDHWHKSKTHKNLHPKGIYNFTETIPQFFSKSGNCLTSLVLHYVFLPHRNLSLILPETVNLSKALSLCEVKLIDFIPDLDIRISLYLAHLQVFEMFAHFDWLLEKLCCQLFSLKLVQNQT